jgi:hypothetical protein
MTPKGANLEGSDLLEVSTLESGSYVTRSITGQEIIDAAASSGGVTDVTGTAPIASTGGSTPAISIATANTSTNGALSSTDWNTFNGKQNALVSGTNIKTINGSSVLGSGDLVVSGNGPTIVAINTASGTPVTGTTTETLSRSLLIPANTYGANGILEIFARWQKTGTLGAQTLRIYLNTSATLTGDINCKCIK